MRVIFFWKCSKFNADLKNGEKNWEKVFCFWAKCIWIFCFQLSLLIREYLSSAVNILRKSLKNFHVSKSNFFQLNYLHSDHSIWSRYWREDWISVSAHLPCGLSTWHLQRDLSDIYLSTSFSVGNFRNSEAMKVTFLRKSWKFNTDLKRAEKNWQKIFCFWEKCLWIVCIELSLLMREYLLSEVNVLRKGLKNFHVSKSDFCNSITFTMITQDDKGALIKIESVFRLVYHVVCRGVLSNGSV